MNRSMFTWAVLASCVMAAPAMAAIPTLGPNLSMQYLIPSGEGDGIFTLGAPAGGALTTNFTPGLRIGFVGQGGNEFYIDTGVAVASTSGSRITNFIGTVNYQRSLGGDTAGPYLTVGGGVYFLDLDLDDSFSNGIFGGGIGTRQMVSDGHGAWRIEGRVDYITKDNNGIDSAVLISSKIGFDLWFN